MASQTTIDNQLKEASLLTDVAWSALVEREAGKWRVLAHYHLGKKTQPGLVKFLAKVEVDSWLCGALSGGQSRSVSLPQSSNLDVARLFAFPLIGVSRVVVAGADQLSNKSQRLWRLVVSGIKNDKSVSDASGGVISSLIVTRS